MTETESKILATILELEQGVETMKSANPKPNLKLLFARIDELTRLLPPGTDASLMHYLQKKSYQKARLFLEGRDGLNQAGNCRHV